MKDFDGFVKVNDLTFPIDEADKIKLVKIVWEDVNLPSQKGKILSGDYFSKILTKIKKIQNH